MWTWVQSVDWAQVAGALVTFVIGMRGAKVVKAKVAPKPAPPRPRPPTIPPASR